jgi:hypothetical protein
MNRKLVVIPAHAIPAFRARFAPDMSFDKFVEFHLSHGGAIRDSDGAFLCWPLVTNDEEAAE